MKSKKLRWLDISSNKLMVDEYYVLWKSISNEAFETSLKMNKDIGYETLRDQWARKVILLPGFLHVERFPLEEPFVEAHREYYKNNSLLMSK